MVDKEDDNILSEEEIQAILSANQAEPSSDDVGEAISKQDLMDLLGSSEEDDLQDIFDMLNKSDNNEIIDEEALDQLKNSENDEAGKLMSMVEGEDSADGVDENLSPKEKKAKAKELRKQQKEAAKLEKEEKRLQKNAEKQARKAEKEAAKKAAKEAKGAAKSGKKASNLPKESGIKSKPQEAFTEDLSDEVQFESLEEISDEEMKELGTLDMTSPEPLSADMQEIDELLNLAGISEDSIATIPAASVEAGDEDVLALLEAIPEKGAEKEKKKGFFSTILDLFTEPDEEDEKGTEDVPMTDENRNILEEIDREEDEATGKKGKKGKKAKKEKVKKEKPKKEKVKKEKAPKTEKVADESPGKPFGNLPKGVIISSLVGCASVLAIILLFVLLGGDYSIKREAKKAFYKEDYETCYQTLYGMELTESEQIMFSKSESILRIRIRIREYEIFMEEDSKPEALDVLILTVAEYEKLHEYASKWNAAREVEEEYATVLMLLQENFNLSEGEALAIASIPDDAEYTKAVMQIVNGGSYTGSMEGENGPSHLELPDMLPEEKLFPENNGGKKE